MYVCVCVRMYICACFICIYLHGYIYMCVCVCLCMYIGTYARMYVCISMYVYMFVYMYVCVWLCMYASVIMCVCMCLCIYVFMDMYVHTYVSMGMYIYVFIYLSWSHSIRCTFKTHIFIYLKNLIFSWIFILAPYFMSCHKLRKTEKLVNVCGIWYEEVYKAEVFIWNAFCFLLRYKKELNLCCQSSSSIAMDVVCYGQIVCVACIYQFRWVCSYCPSTFSNPVSTFFKIPFLCYVVKLETLSLRFNFINFSCLMSLMKVQAV
jgi:hypothetical protein